MRSVFYIFIFLGFFVNGTPPAKSAPIHDFNEAVSSGYQNYREAMFYLQTGNPAVASFELETFAQRWKEIVDRFGASPPDIFTTERKWRKTLKDIEFRIAKGLAAAIDGDAKAAKKHLGPIRKILSALRRRNGVFVYSDIVDRANDAFKQLLKYSKSSPDFEKTEQLDKLRRDLSVTIYWYERSRDDAPPEIKNNPEFNRLMESSLQALSRIWVAIADKRKDILISNLRGLASSDKMLFLRFG
ncbi:MAG: hypothetical protein O3B76_12010 [Proteobacteria bacterium]|nr:hypothetical protein [Pseudomonadota bacterium]MDA1024233.1 hypothetical protein [Pseudomonadota bacterium]